MEVVSIKKILTWNLLIYIGLHCVRRSSWTVTTLATLFHILTLLCIYCFAIQLSHREKFKHFKYNSESLNVFETQNILVKLQCNGDILILVTWFNAALINRSLIQFWALSTYKVPFAIGSFRALALVDLTRMKSGTFSPDILPYFGD